MIPLLLEAVVLAGNHALIPTDRTGNFVELQALVVLVILVLGMDRESRRIAV